MELPEFTDLQDLHEVHDMLAERVKQWPERWEEKGRIEEARENLRSLIKLKFGESPQWVEARMEQAGHTQLRAWMDKILFADSLDEMFNQ